MCKRNGHKNCWWSGMSWSSPWQLIPLHSRLTMSVIHKNFELKTPCTLLGLSRRLDEIIFHFYEFSFSIFFYFQSRWFFCLKLNFGFLLLYYETLFFHLSISLWYCSFYDFIHFNIFYFLLNFTKKNFSPREINLYFANFLGTQLEKTSFISPTFSRLIRSLWKHFATERVRC